LSSSSPSPGARRTPPTGGTSGPCRERSRTRFPRRSRRAPMPPPSPRAGRIAAASAKVGRLNLDGGSDMDGSAAMEGGAGTEICLTG
jgi:hypothetical protein